MTVWPRHSEPGTLAEQPDSVRCNVMRRLSRLDVSIDMAVHLLLVLLLCRGAVHLIARSQLLQCYSDLVLYTMNTAELLLRGGLGYGLGLVVIAVAWLETRVNLRPWFKRVLRLSGPLFLASLLLPLLLNHATDLALLEWLDARWSLSPGRYSR